MTTLTLKNTQIEIRGAEHDVRVMHYGTKDLDTLAVVRENTDKMLGKGVFDALFATRHKEYGRPDDVYMLVAPVEAYMDAAANAIADSIRDKS